MPDASDEEKLEELSSQEKKHPSNVCLDCEGTGGEDRSTQCEKCGGLGKV